MLSFFITLLTILEVLVCLLLTLLVLMQRPRQEGLGAAFGSGMTDQMFGAQTTNVLQRATVYLGSALFALTFILAVLVAKQDNYTHASSALTEPSDKLATPVVPTSPPGAMPTDVKAAPAPAASTPAPATKPADAKPSPVKPAAEAKPAVENKTQAPAPAATTPAPAPVKLAPAPAVSTPAPAPAPVTPPPAAPAPAKGGN